jgi:hypothetical protein
MVEMCANAYSANPPPNCASKQSICSHVV